MRESRTWFRSTENFFGFYPTDLTHDPIKAVMYSPNHSSFFFYLSSSKVEQIRMKDREQQRERNIYI